MCPAELQLQFHGGFSGQSCHLEAESDDAGWTDVMKFYPRDSSSLQVTAASILLLPSTMSVHCCKPVNSLSVIVTCPVF